MSCLPPKGNPVQDDHGCSHEMGCRGCKTAISSLGATQKRVMGIKRATQEACWWSPLLVNIGKIVINITGYIHHGQRERNGMIHAV